MHYGFRRTLQLVAVAAFLIIAGRASAQSSVFDFEDGTDQGFGHKFGDDASESFPVTSIGGSKRMGVLRNGDFQEADHGEGNTSTPFYKAMLAASADEANYEISYDWYVDTSTFGGGAGTFLQMGTYVNTGSGYYAQHFPATGKEVELSGAQLTSGTVLSGTVDQTFAAKGFDLPTGETFFRLGFIINGDGANQLVYLDNIIVRPVPEPASASIVAVGAAALLRRKRKAA